MTWIGGLGALAFFLIAGLFLYLAARSRSSEKTAKLHELQRRGHFFDARLLSLRKQLDHYRQQLRSLVSLSDELERSTFRDPGETLRLREAVFRYRMLGLPDARLQLPYALSLIAHGAGDLALETDAAIFEFEELRRWPKPPQALEVDKGLSQLREIRGEITRLQEEMQRELEQLRYQDERWSRLQEQLLHLELRSASGPKEPPESYPSLPQMEISRSELRSFSDSVQDFRRLIERSVPPVRQSEEAAAHLRYLTERLSEDVPRITDTIWQHSEARLMELEREWRQRMEERLPALQPPKETRSPVLLQSLWPQRVRPEEWHTVLVYLSRDFAGLVEAEADARRRLRVPLETYAESTSAAIRPISEGTLVTVVPELPSFRFNPPVATLLWLEDWHCAELRMQALPEAVPGTTVEGRIAFYVGPILIGENDLEVEILEPGSAETAVLPLRTRTTAPLPGRSLAAAYRSIFVSYSHDDSDIVDRLQAAYRALGDTYFRDIEILRSGEAWSPALLEKVREADVFQLCWSEASRASSFVEKEWRYALELGRERFVRPMYWRKPCPGRPAELDALHFAYVEMDL